MVRFVVQPSAPPFDDDHSSSDSSRPSDPSTHSNGDLHPHGVAAMHTVPSIVAHQQELAQAAPRDQWGSDLQFVLSCIGYVVGLGNIWRFPSLAYENGGGAFLIPYLICSAFFGLPLILLEQSIGQFTQAGPSVGLAYYAPILQGVGWSMAAVGSTVGMYYNVVVAWSSIYLYKIVVGQSGDWSSCRNDWNTFHCESSLEDAACLASSNGSLGFYFNQSCYGTDMKDALRDTVYGAVSPAEEFFENFVTQRSSGMDDLGGINWKVFGALFGVWCLVALAMSQGVRWLGKLAFFSATVPYIIIAAFFVRGITLDGSYEGIEFYLLRPDFSHVYNMNTWKAALTHCCFSLSIGFGGIMAMSSYNDFKHNCYKVERCLEEDHSVPPFPFPDVLTVVIADNFMNVFGGTAVFATLGFMAKQLGKPVAEVVQSGTSLIFVAYPEAMARMPFSAFWAFLFFFMLFVLGITTSFGYTQVIVTCLRDESAFLYPHRALLTCGAALSMFLGGIIICTRAGIYWFNVFNDFTGSTCICLVGVIEVVWMTHVYGLSNLVADLREMFGSPQTRLTSIFGSTGLLIRFEFALIAPLFGMVVLISTFFRSPLTYGKGTRIYYYPWWAEVFGWLLVSVPISLMVVGVVYKVIDFRSRKKPLSELFRVQQPLRSFTRIRGPVTKATT